ncbi:MAG TPA: ankyrin repeat domain-containing protein [Gemmatimonadaceae bacterium]|jgi:ankyrin repeat protein|nr:ankyrin repeat domain-containing protein [Gemmatimonadaceae bacterium]
MPDHRQPDSSLDLFLRAVIDRDAEGARRVLAEDAAIPARSLHAAATIGDITNVRRLIGNDASVVSLRAGDPSAEPLLYLCYSPFHGESPRRDADLLETVRLLLQAGADPNTRDSRYGVPVLFAVTGARSILPIARLLLDAGANPTDGESVFHAAERFHVEALELLLAAGADLNYVGEWGNTALYFLLRWYDVEKEPQVRQGLDWLLTHGADPNVTSGPARETALHIAARLGQHVSIIRSLLEHGADVDARRRDGMTAWRLARRGGFDGAAAALEQAGALVEPLSPAEELLAACGRGDVDAARQLSTPEIVDQLTAEDRQCLPEAAMRRRGRAVIAYVAAALPTDTTDGNGSTALHYAAISGGIEQVRALLAAGADFTLRDREHSATPLGWACFGVDFVANTDGDYEACVRALLDAGARPEPGDYEPRHAGVRALVDDARR